MSAYDAVDGSSTGIANDRSRHTTDGFRPADLRLLSGVERTVGTVSSAWPESSLQRLPAGWCLCNGSVMAYSLYILRCADGTYYTGITTDMARRLSEHNGLSGSGAKYTSARRPVEIVYEASFPSRSEALKEELRIKQLTRSQKQELISGVI
jgi:putative endonuclease